MKNFKSIGLLSVAVLFSVIAGYSSIKYLEHREQALREEFDEKVNYVEVIVPSKNLSVGDIISANTVSLRPIPGEYLPAGVLYPSDFDSIVGLSLENPANIGAPLLREQLAGLAGIDKFSQLLKPNQRAITLPIDQFDSNENMIVSGDFIDVVVKIENKNNTPGSGSLSVSSLLNKVLVLATGVATVADPAHFRSEVARQGYGSITLGVSSKDVPRIFAAQQAGELSFLLRHPDDSSKSDIASANGLFGQDVEKGVLILSAGNSESGLLTGKYKTPSSSSKNLWVSSKNSGRLYQKFTEKRVIAMPELSEVSER